MKKISVILAVVLCALSVSLCRASTDERVRFDSTVWNFGRIEESDGIVEHTFRFTNISDTPLVVGNVKTSCGCTTADHSTRPIRNGDKGTISVRFDPNGFTGRIEKTVTVVFAGVDGIVQLNIRGTVIPRPRSVTDDYPFVLAGGVRAETATRSFGYMAQGKTVSMAIGIVNTAERRVEIDTLWSTRSGLMRFDAPAWLEAGEKGLVTLTYDLSDTVHYGILSDQVRLVIDGMKADIPLSGSAVAVDDFDSDAEMEPKAEFDTVFHNFGILKRGEKACVEIEISNRGSAPLVVRSVECRTNTHIELEEGDTFAPDSSRRVKLTMQVENDDFDSVFGGVVIITNDPARPMRELRITSQIEYE